MVNATHKYTGAKLTFGSTTVHFAGMSVPPRKFSSGFFLTGRPDVGLSFPVSHVTTRQGIEISERSDLSAEGDTAVPIGHSETGPSDPDRCIIKAGTFQMGLDPRMNMGFIPDDFEEGEIGILPKRICGLDDIFVMPWLRGPFKDIQISSKGLQSICFSGLKQFGAKSATVVVPILDYGSSKPLADFLGFDLASFMRTEQRILLDDPRAAYLEVDPAGLIMAICINTVTNDGQRVRLVLDYPPSN